MENVGTNKTRPTICSVDSKAYERQINSEAISVLDGRR
jgi:hypothetical protein